MLDELQRDAPRLGDVAAPDAQLAVHHRRVVEDEKFLAARRAVRVHDAEGRSGEGLGQLARIGDGGRAADEDRLRSVEFADAPQAPQQVRQVAAVDAAIVVQLVDHHVAQILEQLGPAGVVRQDAAMQHVRIGEHDVGALADGLAGILRRIAIVGECPDFRAHLVDGGLQLVELVFGQGLGREKVHGAGAWIGQQQVQDGQVVAQRFAAGGGGDHHHVLALFDRLEGFRLVGIELMDAAVHQGLPQGGVHASGRS